MLLPRWVVPLSLLLVGTTARGDVPAAAPSRDPSGERWSLRRFEDEAHKRNLAIEVAQEEVRLNVARRMEAAWARFPMLTWTSAASPMGSMKGDVFSTTTPTNQYFGFNGIYQQHKLEMLWPVFTFGKLRNAYKAADAGVRAATSDVERARAEVVRDVRKAFYASKVAAEVMKVVEEGSAQLADAEKNLEKNLEKAKTDPKLAKEVDPLDKNRIITFSAEVQSRREEALVFAQLSKAALRVATGLSESTPVEADGAQLQMVQAVVPPIEQLIETALTERPELKSLRSVVEVRHHLANLQRSYYYPDFFIAGQVGIARCNVCADQLNPFAFDPFNLDLYGGAVGLRMTLDFPQKIARVRQADAEKRKMELQQQRAREGVRLEVRKAWLEWRQAREQAAIITKGRKSAQGWLFQASINFSTGLVKLRDLTDALASWFKFRLEELRSVYNYNAAVATLSQVIGRDLPTGP